MTDGDRLLRIYLNDHLAASAGAISLAQRSLRNNRDGELGAFLRELLGEIVEDRETLVRAAAALGFRRNPAKEASMKLAERAGRLKLNGRVREYSPLSRVLELEGLALGVEGKRRLWIALADSGREVPVDLAALTARAERQAAGLDEHRRAAARAAFAR